MGITGELVRSVFSKSRSVGTHDSNVRNSPGERKRWSAVRSYLCGDEINSVLAEEDSASWRSSNDTGTQLDFSSVFAEEDSGSVRGSEATVTQPMLEDLTENEEIEREEKKEQTLKEKHNSTSKLFVKDDAAVVIQSAFRSFLARRQNERLKSMNDEEGLTVGNGSPSRESIGTSIEVQTANSVSIHEGSPVHPNRMQAKSGRAQVWRLKEDWDDSTVSSNISKMRIQNRLEATTRRERALAYAFSQQLRICSKKKQSRSNDGTEPNMGWSWLERWMATRQQESPLVDISKQIEQLSGNQKLMVKKRLLFDLTGELEKESCGSNEGSLQMGSVAFNAPTEKDYYKPARNRLKATNLSRQKTVPTYNYSKENAKVSKKDCPGEDEKEKTYEAAKQAGSKRESICEDATSQISPETETSNNSQLSL